MAEPHTGAMVALVPSKADAARLALPGGEAVDELHCTLVFLGKAIDIEESDRARIIGSLRSLVEDAIRPDYDLPVRANAFAVNVFNPTGEEPCLVLGVGGSDLAAVRRLVAEELRGQGSPEQHEPWVPHVTLLYATDPASRIADGIDRVGPVTFDRLRVAFGGEVTDIPLRGVMTAREAWFEAERLLEHLPGLHDQRSHGRRFNIPGDAKSGIRKAAKAAAGKPDGGHDRAGAAHSVADAVDDALAGLDIPEHHKSAISHKARAAADVHGAHPNPRAPEREKPAPPASVDRAVADAGHLAATTGRPPSVPAASRGQQIEGEIRAAVADLAREPGGYVSLEDVRDRLGSRYTREEVDRVLDDMFLKPGVALTPEGNQKTLTPGRRAAAINIGMQDQHLISIAGVGGTAPPPVANAATARAKFAAGANRRMPNVLTPQDAITRLRGASGRADGERLLANASRADLIAILDAGNWSYGKNYNKTELRRTIVELLVGRRLDSDAIMRSGGGGMTRG